MSVTSFEDGLVWNNEFMKLPEKLRSEIVNHIRRQNSEIYRLEKLLAERSGEHDQEADDKRPFNGVRIVSQADDDASIAALPALFNSHQPTRYPPLTVAHCSKSRFMVSGWKMSKDGKWEGLCDCNQGRLPCTCKPEPLHPHNDGLDEYRQPVHVGELDPAQRLTLARGELK